MPDWIADHARWMVWAGLISVATFLVTLILIPVLLVRMRADYFVSKRPPAESWTGRHRIVRWLGLIAKNVLGLVLIVAGLGMLVLPGQGILTIVIGLGLLNFPGKRRLELWIVRQRPVRRAIDRIRARFGRPPLEMPASQLRRQDSSLSSARAPQEAPAQPGDP